MHDETSPIVLGKVQITEIIAVGIKLGGEFEVCDAIYLTNALVEISIGCASCTPSYCGPSYDWNGQTMVSRCCI